MAILLEGAEQSPVMWGKIGEHVIYRSDTGKMYLRKFTHPTNPRTPAQLMQREAYSEGLKRWKNYESVNNKEFWDDIRMKQQFIDGRHAFLSSFLLTYQQKRQELGDHTLALNYVNDTLNQIEYLSSPGHQQKQLDNLLKIKAVLKYRQSTEFKTRLKESISYLKSKGWLNETKYGVIPYIDEFREEELRIKKIVPFIGGFGTGAYGRGIYGA